MGIKVFIYVGTWEDPFHKSWEESLLKIWENLWGLVEG